MGSKELNQLQDNLLNYIKDQLNHPTIDFKSVKANLKLLEKVDAERRETWHKEKFGVYEEIADQCLSKDFTMDDIPF